MNLDAVTAELRPRGAWEAADFGARMIRRDVAVIYKTWFILTLPLLFIASLGIIFSPYHGWIQTGYWWLEPITDGPILYIISRRLFGERTDVRAALRATPTLLRQNWVFLVTPLRLHFARSLAIPLTQLEGLSGQRRRERAKVLNGIAMNHGIGVTAAYQHLFLALFFGVVLLGFAFIPESYQDTIGLKWFGTFFEEEQTVANGLLGLLLFYIAQTALHPWFVGAGFGIYINCRTMLEAWDIEVAFRRMLQRRASRGAAAATILLALAIMPAPAPAETTELKPYWDTATIEAADETVFSDEALQRTRTIKEWASTAEDTEDESDTSDSSGVARFFEGLGRLIAGIVEFGFWILAAIVVLAIAMSARYWLPYLRYEQGPRRRRQRVILSSGEITAEMLPDDIPTAVAELWKKGEKREALSLLYRGSVFAVVEQHGVRLPNSATEGVCVAAVGHQAPGPQAEFFNKVVAAWVWCAYGARAPADGTISVLCDEWPKHYQVTT